jgi:hypothetical protein
MHPPSRQLACRLGLTSGSAVSAKLRPHLETGCQEAAGDGGLFSHHTTPANKKMDVTKSVQPQHDLSPIEIDAIMGVSTTTDVQQGAMTAEDWAL